MKKTVAIILVLLLALTGCAAKQPVFTDDLKLIAQTVDDSTKVSTDIAAIAQWQLDGSAAYKKQNAIYLESGKESDRPEDTDPEEVKAKFDQLTGLAAQLKEQSSKIAALKPQGVASYDGTLKAANEYYSEINGVAGDMKTVFQYYFDMQDAIKPFSDFSEADSTTGVQDYALYAGQLSQVTSQTQKALDTVKCPPYMQNSHDMLKQRMDEFQSFCQDFSIAVQMGDPLRLTSSEYRINRLSIMLEQCDEHLTDDFDLQFEQVIKRLDGRIGTLHKELASNTATLLDAVGR